jgi:hypothetical protein
MDAGPAGDAGLVDVYSGLGIYSGTQWGIYTGHWNWSVTGYSPIHTYDATAGASVGRTVCKQGRTTASPPISGYSTCGQIEYESPTQLKLNGALTCHGDSGGPVDDSTYERGVGITVSIYANNPYPYDEDFAGSNSHNLVTFIDPISDPVNRFNLGVAVQ